MKFISVLLLVSTFLSISTSDYEKEVLAFQQELNDWYRDAETSPFHTKKERKQFTGHHFFPINPAYKVTATVELLPESDEHILMFNTSNGSKREYQRYALLTFELKGTSHQLYAYVTPKTNNKSAFLPFTDETSGEETYGGGRYIDLEVPFTETVEIDFNLAYNPYCAYTSGYACAIPPQDNHVNIKIEAGTKAYH